MEAHKNRWDKVLIHLDDKVMVKQLNQGEGHKKETRAIIEDIFLQGNLFCFCKFDCDSQNRDRTALAVFWKGGDTFPGQWMSLIVGMTFPKF